MNKQNIKNVLAKYLVNEATEVEIQHIIKWLEEPDNLKAFKNYIALNHTINQEFIRFNSVEAFEKTLKRIEQEKKVVEFPISNLIKYGVAASVLLLVSLSFVFNEKPAQTETPIIVDNNIKIGSDKATLTLEDGADVVLEKGEDYQNTNLSSNGEVLVYKSDNSKKDIAYNYLTIPRGGQFNVELSDGTKVWLNSESKLKYPVKFIDGETRQVELIYGEAYFDVSPSENHKGSKFKVNTLIQEVVVLGTEFNIKAYKDEAQIYTTLVEGKVEIGNDISNEELKPNQQSTVNVENNHITISEVDVYNEISWRKGVFSFKNKSLKDMMQVLSRWYNIDIEFENNTLKDLKFNGVLSKTQNIENILLTIKTTNDFAYEINQDRILIK